MWAALALLAAAQDVAPARPTDRRELSTDRPDKTESPYTVDGGRFQIEMDVATYTRDREGGIRTETVGVAPINVKYGLDRATDLQLIVQPYLRRTVADRRLGARETVDGVGDTTVRVKRNLWGDDGGRTAFALMPFVTLPTATDGLGAGKVEFGLIAPLAIALSDRIGLGLMTELDVVGQGDGTGHRASFVNSATIGVALTDRLGMYTELFTERGDDWVVTGDLGFTYALSDYVQLDAGANLGVTHAADDLAMFVGVSRRF